MLQSSLHEIMISIHALREEGDLGLRYEGDNAKVFLSTPSARRATGCGPAGVSRGSISIHALREEGDERMPERGQFISDISIHALREEGDRRNFIAPPAAFNFYPRPPRGGRHALPCLSAEWIQISIHALREEGDSKQMHATARDTVFLSTPSVRRATACALLFCKNG